MALEYWPVYLSYLQELEGDYLKAGLGHFKVFCELNLPESHRQDFYECVRESIAFDLASQSSLQI